MKTCRKWVAALFAIILTVSSCVVVAGASHAMGFDGNL